MVKDNKLHNIYILTADVLSCTREPLGDKFISSLKEFLSHTVLKLTKRARKRERDVFVYPMRCSCPQ